MRVVILVLNTSPWPVLHNCEVSWFYSQWISRNGADAKLHLKPSRGNNLESMKARVVILVCHTSSWPVLHSCEVSWLYSKGYASYRSDTKLHLKCSRGNNLESMTAKVVILVRNTLSCPVLHNCEVSWLYSKPFLSYGADTKLHLKPSRGNNSESMKARFVIFYTTYRHDLFYITVMYHDYITNGIQATQPTRVCIWNHQWEKNSESMKARVVILVCDTSSWLVLHNCEESWSYSKWYSSYRGDTNMHKKASKGR